MNQSKKKISGKTFITIVFYMMLFMNLPGLYAQNQGSFTVKGVIKSGTETLPGASVVVKGTTSGTVTDYDGNYSITVPNEQAVLEFTFMGYTKQEKQVGKQRTIDINLEEDTKLLDEIVVVGYGQMKRSDLTGAVSSVNTAAIQKTVATSIDQVLQGRAAGVQVQQNTGMPGGSSSTRIRGISSLNGSNEPIYVIDGVIIDGSSGSNNSNPLSDINPSDIVSVDILKDASAAAIYGSRAGSGVIIITTKRGQKGDSSINFDSYIGWQQMPKKLDMMNLQQYATHKNERSDLGIVEGDDNFVRPDLLGEGTDWQKEMFSTAMMQNYNLSITGGNDKTSYLLGGAYLDQEGIAVGSGFKRYNLNGSFDSQVKKFLKSGISFAFSNSEQQITVSDESLIKVALKQTPNVAVRNADGSYDGPDTDQYVQNNPVGLAMIKDNSNEKANIRANTYAEATIIKGLVFKTDLSIDYGMTNTYKFDPSYKFGAIANDVREGNYSKSYSKFWAWRNVLTYNNTFNEKHALTAMLGQEMQKSRWEYLSGYRSGYLSNGAKDLDAGDATTAKNNGSSGDHALMSYFGRLFYSYDDRYLLTTTLRADGSSNFAPNHQWGWFPSAALAWKISNEGFLKDNDVIDNLKLRLGWGKVGNQNLPAFSFVQTFSTVATNWGTGLLAANTPNPDLMWESTTSTNIGLDLNLFNSRIEFVADVYSKKTDNLLLQLPLPAYVGVGSSQGAASAPWKNIGSLENKGLELTLNTVNIDTKNFRWGSNFVFSMNRNKTSSLDTETGVIDVQFQEGSDVTIITRTAVGQPIGQFYGYKVIGRFEKATDFYYKDANGSVKPVPIPKGMSISENGAWIGDYIFEDINKDGVIDDGDLTYIGNPEPKFTYGIGNTFSYKGFDLTIFLTGSYGNDVVNYQRRWLENPRENTNLLAKARNYAHLALIDPNGPNDYRNVYIASGDWDMPRIAASSASSASNYRFSDKFVEDGSYLRIQNISLSYTLPHKWVNKMGLQRVKLYTNLQNLYTFTKYSGYDPEIGSLNQNALITGFDNARYPLPRIYTFGVNVSF